MYFAFHCNLYSVLSVISVALFVCIAVDFLAEVGVDPGDDGVDPGSPLMDNTTSLAWQQISSDFPIGFAVYTRAVLDDYSGVIISLNDGDLFISLESLNPALQILTVALPGKIPLIAAIPSAMPATLQTIGVSIKSKLLTVIVNCSVINSVWLVNTPNSFDFSFAEAFNPSTTVSWNECFDKEC